MSDDYLSAPPAALPRILSLNGFLLRQSVRVVRTVAFGSEILDVACESPAALPFFDSDMAAAELPGLNCVWPAELLLLVPNARS